MTDIRIPKRYAVITEQQAECPVHGPWYVSAAREMCPVCDWPGHSIYNPGGCCSPGEGCNS